MAKSPYTQYDAYSPGPLSQSCGILAISAKQISLCHLHCLPSSLLTYFISDSKVPYRLNAAEPRWMGGSGGMCTTSAPE